MQYSEWIVHNANCDLKELKTIIEAETIVEALQRVKSKVDLKHKLISILMPSATEQLTDEQCRIGVAHNTAFIHKWKSMLKLQTTKEVLGHVITLQRFAAIDTQDSETRATTTMTDPKPTVIRLPPKLPILKPSKLSTFKETNLDDVRTRQELPKASFANMARSRVNEDKYHHH